MTKATLNNITWYFHDCTACHGRGFRVVADLLSTPKVQCRACKGTGYTRTQGMQQLRKVV